MDYGDYGVDESEDLALMALKVGDVEVANAGVAKSGIVYLQGDIHPQGSFAALMKAARSHVPYVAVSAVSVLFPADWLRAECMGDPDRVRIIDNAVAFVRGSR